MVLDKWVRFKVSAAALEMIDRMGGIDVYCLRVPVEELGGDRSVAGLFRQMLLNRMEEIKNEKTDDNNTQKSILTFNKDKKGESAVVYSTGEQKFTWRDGLDHEFWQNKDL